MILQTFIWTKLTQFFMGIIYHGKHIINHFVAFKKELLTFRDIILPFIIWKKSLFSIVFFIQEICNTIVRLFNIFNFEIIFYKELFHLINFLYWGKLSNLLNINPLTWMLSYLTLNFLNNKKKVNLSILFLVANNSFLLLW